MQHLIAIRKELEKELDTFPSRNADLCAIKRYSRYPHMLYRTNLFLHGKRVASSMIYSGELVQECIPDFDFKRAIALALVHDDAELVMGDFQSSNRAIMSKEEIANLDSNEERAIQIIVKQYPNRISGFVYEELLSDVLHLHTREAQIIKYLDKLEGFAEAMHELYAGNATFLGHPPTEFGVPPNPFEYYPQYFRRLEEKLPITTLLSLRDPFFSNCYENNWNSVLASASPHTAQSLEASKGFVLYDDWVQAQLASEDDAIIASLVEIKER